MAEQVRKKVDRKEEKADVSIQKKRECFTNSKKAIASLLECNISESFLLEQVKFITQTDYQDVTEERALSKICGYPICDSKLGHIPSKKYHISTNSNKVYDITERKNFCSNRCYKASMHLKEQISISLEWLRDGEDFSSIHLLTKTDKIIELPGVEVIGLEKLSIDDNKPKQEIGVAHSVSSFAFSALEELQEIGGSSYESLLIKEQIFSSNVGDPSQMTSETFSKVNTEAQEKKNVQQKEFISCESLLIEEQTFSKSEEPGSPLQKISSEMNIEEKVINIEEKIINIPSVQFTSSFISNDLSRSVKKTTNSLPRKACNIPSSTEISVEIPKTSKKNEEICQPVKEICQPVQEICQLIATDLEKIKGKPSNLLQPQEKSPIVPKKQSSKEKFSITKVNKTIEEWFTLNTLFYIAGFDELMKKVLSKIQKLETSEEEINALEVKEKLLELCNELREKHSSDHQKYQLNALELKVKAFYEGKTVIRPDSSIQITRAMPPIDKYNQKLLRQKLVWDKLSKILPELLEILDISEEIFAESKALTESFNFGAHNVMLKPNEWNLMGLIIIKMISEKRPTLKTGLTCKKTSRRLIKMLHSLNLEPTYLDTLVNNLFDLQTINL